MSTPICIFEFGCVLRGFVQRIQGVLHYLRVFRPRPPYFLHVLCLFSPSLGYCMLLHPFKWQNILIPIVPNKCLELLEAPVPCIMGLKGTVTQGKQIAQSMVMQETMIVLLDSGEIIDCFPPGASSDLKKLPHLSNLKSKIAPDYAAFLSLKNYQITNAMKEAAGRIATSVQVAIEKTILTYLPSILPHDESGKVDLKRMRECVVKSTKPIDEEFVLQVCHTQMFATYLDELDKRKMESVKFEIGTVRDFLSSSTQL
eukprot:TRINITY_DN14702_c0_g1_i2.p1 TRINITY_DN14702_c0_g1~~TRINITY_DN14702_c0_g1_i2.p1  ORF type:complete len:257 (+),score=26.25 TRINITY_DN14702_c0_g1_i2:338-1108(+)